jgi:hypothetical protein
MFPFLEQSIGISKKVKLEEADGGSGQWSIHICQLPIAATLTTKHRRSQPILLVLCTSHVLPIAQELLNGNLTPTT